MTRDNIPGGIRDLQRSGEMPTTRVVTASERRLAAFKRVFRQQLQADDVDVDTVASHPEKDRLRVAVTAAGDDDATTLTEAVLYSYLTTGWRADLFPSRCVIDIHDSEAGVTFRAHMKRDWVPEPGVSDTQLGVVSEKVNDSLRELE